MFSSQRINNNDIIKLISKCENAKIRESTKHAILIQFSLPEQPSTITYCVLRT